MDDAPNGLAEQAHVQVPGSKLHGRQSMKLPCLAFLVCASAYLIVFSLALLKAPAHYSMNDCTWIYRPSEVSSSTYLPKPVLLDVSSMWAVGVHARFRMKRRTAVPLVTWKPEAIQQLQHIWQVVQFRKACDRALIMWPWHWGITSQMRDYSNIAIASVLTFQRTLVVYNNSKVMNPKTKKPNVKWCKDNLWLECFFLPLNSGACHDVQVSQIPHVFARNFKAVADSTPVYRLSAGSKLYQLIDDTGLFPHKAWNSMMSKGLVKYHNDLGNKIDPSQLKKHSPQLYHLISLSALRSMFTPVIFQPQPRLLIAASYMVSKLKPTKRCVSVHFRWTDKRKDTGITSKMNFSTGHVPAALNRIVHRTGYPYMCLLVLSDDDHASFNSVRSRLGSSHDVALVSQLRSLFTPEEYKEYRKSGHDYVQSLTLRDPARVYTYFDAVVVDILVAVQSSDYLIGVGSSGVSQLIAQYMGARHMADGNAFAVWQEDILLL